VDMPSPETNGFVRTLNNMGYMTSSLDPCSEAFVQFAPVGPGPALDIGAAYGVATLAALARGARVIANDLDARHLDILASRTQAEHRTRLALMPGAFPDELSVTEPCGSILIARVLHFFNPQQLRTSFATAASWLAPGGKLFIITETPYLKNFATFTPVYEQRRAAGEEWPGLISDVAAFAPERAKFLPPLMHFLDPDVLRREATRAGLIVESCEFINRTDFPEDIRLDGRESVGLVARRAENNTCV